MIPKFRVFCERHKCIEELYQITYLGDNDIKVEAECLSGYVGSDFVLMQSTGLRDKHGVEIFEGDIVKFQDELHPIEFNKYRFEADGFWRNWQDDPGDFFSEGAYKEYEVIGNVHENPELLEAT